MAVVVTRSRSNVAGDRRMMLMNVNIGATGQTLASPLHVIDTAIVDGSGSTAVNNSHATGGGGPITFNYTGGGAQNNCDVMIIGR